MSLFTPSIVAVLLVGVTATMSRKDTFPSLFASSLSAILEGSSFDGNEVAFPPRPYFGLQLIAATLGIPPLRGHANAKLARQNASSVGPSDLEAPAMMRAGTAMSFSLLACIFTTIATTRNLKAWCWE